MKKIYAAPQLINHGAVNQITAYSFDSSRKDTFFGAPANVPSSGTGSLDACLTKGGVYCK